MLPPPPLPHPELRPGFLQRLCRGVQGAPSVGQLRLPPLPALQEQCRPHHVKKSENHAADVLTSLEVRNNMISTLIVTQVKTFSLFFSGQRLRLCTQHLVRLSKNPEQKANDSRVEHGVGIETQPGKVHTDLHTEVVADVVCRVGRCSLVQSCEESSITYCSVDLLHRVSYPVAAFHTQPGPMKSSAD